MNNDRNATPQSPSSQERGPVLRSTAEDGRSCPPTGADTKPTDQNVPAPMAPANAPRSDFAAWLHTWRFLFWLLGVALVILLFYAIENWRGQRAWQKYQQSMAASGQAVEFRALVPPEVAEVENFANTPFLARLFRPPGLPPQPGEAASSGESAGFASRYNAAERALQWPTAAEQRAQLSKPARSNSWVTTRTDLSAWYVAFQEPTNRDASERQTLLRRYALPGHKPAGDKPATVAPAYTARDAAAGVLAGLSDCEPVLEELRSASRRPHSRFDLHYGEANPAAMLLPHLATLKHVSQVLRLRAAAELALGRTDDAFNDVTLMLYLAGACRDEPLLISQLVRIAQLQLALQPLAEGLAGRQWSAPQLRAFEERLRALDFCADVRRVLRSERIFGCGVIDYIRRSHGALEQVGESSSDLQGVLLRVVPSGWFEFEKLNLCRAYDDCLLPMIDVAGHQVRPSATVQAQERIARMLKPAPAALFFQHRTFAAMLLPAMVGVAQKAAFAQTGVELAAVACALERCRLGQGQYPERLEALVPPFLDRLPRDLINGQPLKYRRIADGQFVVYSVGWNETDDGGTVAVGQSGEHVDPSKGDWVWRNP